MKISSKTSSALRKTIQSMEKEIESLALEVADKDSQIIGYRAVISYLEFQLGLKESQQ